MDNVFAKINCLAKNKYYKVISNYTLFDTINFKISKYVPYNPDHNLDEDSWFMIEKFSDKKYCLDILTANFDSKDHDALIKDNFRKIAYLFSVQNNDFYFQKISPSLFILKKSLVFGDVAKIEDNINRLVINTKPDAIYYHATDTLIFRNLATISSIFPGIDEIYKVATNKEVKKFLDQSFIELASEYTIAKVSKPNRKRVSLALASLADMSEVDRVEMLGYINDYSLGILEFNTTTKKFKISTDETLKYLLYGVEQRFYTTPFGKEKRLANSVLKI